MLELNRLVLLVVFVHLLGRDFRGGAVDGFFDVGLEVLKGDLQRLLEAGFRRERLRQLVLIGLEEFLKFLLAGVRHVLQELLHLDGHHLGVGL